MIREPVSSSRIKSVGWANNTLEIEFSNGAVYPYHGVTQNEYVLFLDASSLGTELNKLKNNHPYNRI
ncbi:MAG: KTSC domain-containing protein [Anaerocolumna sp.]